MSEFQYTPPYSRAQRAPYLSASSPESTKKFVILSIGRTEFDVPSQIVGKHPDITLHGHLFGEKEAVAADPKYLGSWTFESRDEYPMKFLDHIWHASGELTGFLTCPEDWNGRQEILERIVGDPNMKVIVWTGNPLESFVMSRQHMNEFEIAVKGFQFSSHSMQEYIDNFEQEKKFYRNLFRNTALWVTQEDFLNHPTASLSTVFEFLELRGANCLPKIVLERAKNIRKFNPWDFVADNVPTHVYEQIIYSFKYTSYVDRNMHASERTSLKPSLPTIDEEVTKWGLLVPITADRNAYDWDALQEFMNSLKSSISETEMAKTMVLVGIDADDHVLGTESAKCKILKYAEPLKVKFITLSHSKGHMCKIWSTMAFRAFQESCDFVVLLGDDISFESEGWQTSVQNKFRQIASDNSYAFGVGCVALCDLTFPNFPTFPVMHRKHVQVHNDFLPPELVNQGGDPFLFELYDRIGAAVIDESAKIRNNVGGNSPSRYRKRTVRFKNSVLSNSLTTLRKSLGEQVQVPSIDVVVPTYRLDMKVLDEILSLRVSVPSLVKFWIVVDNPSHPNLPALREKYDGKYDNGNYRTQILVHPENLGASVARNTGIMRSYADWIVFFDDDISPEPNVLDAYMAATLRYPNCDGLVGVTRLPEARTIWQQGLALSGVALFYRIAFTTSRPPWSVTANLCVRGRTNTSVLFRPEYPNSGGGEDVDFCLRLKRKRDGFVSVPEAVVSHPWFGKSAYLAVKHVLKWVTGDSRCVENLPGKTFGVVPGWTEFLLFSCLPSMALGCFFRLGGTVVALETGFKSWIFLKEIRRTSATSGVMRSLLVALFASFVLMGQEAVRTACHLKRRRADALCRRFDWFDGKDPEFVRESKKQNLYKLLTYVFVFIYFIF